MRSRHGNRGDRARRALLVAAVSTLAALAASISSPRAAAPTAAEARQFIEKTEKSLLELTVKASRAEWVHSTFITDDTEMIAAQADQELLAARMKAAKAAARFKDLKLPADVARKILLLRTSMSLAAPSDPNEQTELSQIAASLESQYGKGKYCRANGECLDLTKMERILAESRDPAELLELWKGWRTISPPMRGQYRRFAELGNKGSRELGFADLGALWRSAYDMPPGEFAAEMDRLWLQVRPLYESLHTYVRAQLAKKYGAAMVPDGKPIPAHLLGNMWAQSWVNIYDLMGMEKSGPGYDLTLLLRAKKVDAKEMVRYGERFFVSLGFEPLPPTFWERSLFVKPADHDVVCHASAWDIDTIDDLRIKMCIDVNDEDFSTIHHELGHNYYDRAYNKQPPLFRGGANDGFHEGVGDTLALSITPDYLVKIGLLDKAPGPEGDLGLLMKMALDKVAFLPFGLMVDKWRWKVFSGEIGPADYNKGWWDLVEKYQGVAPPVVRSESDFDPGAKYHVPANTPYARYFLADIYQFQFHRALCRAAGYNGPLHLCSIYGNKQAGERLAKMLQMGASRPWPEALEAMTGERKLDATAIIDYFAPLKKWLDEQNKGRVGGWK